MTRHFLCWLILACLLPRLATKSEPVRCVKRPSTKGRRMFMNSGSESRGVSSKETGGKERSKKPAVHLPKNPSNPRALVNLMFM